MLLVAKCNELETLSRVTSKLVLTSGSYVVAHVQGNYVVRTVYCSLTHDLRNFLEQEVEYAQTMNTELNIVLSSAKTVCKACTDCVMCVSMFGDVMIEPLYSYLVEKNVETVDVKPEMLLLDVIATMYDSDASYSLEKTVELFTEFARSRKIAIENLHIAITQIRECCANMYVVSLAYSKNTKLFVSIGKNHMLTLTLPEELLTYASVRELTSSLSTIEVPCGKSLTIRIAPEVLWYTVSDIDGV